LSIKDAHDRQYNYMKITIITLIGMIRFIGFNIQDIQIHVNIQFVINNFDKYSDPCNRLRINGIIQNNKCIFTKLNAVFILKTAA
jgi:hypothetical protein